jgi:hypothetical protein
MAQRSVIRALGFQSFREGLQMMHLSTPRRLRKDISAVRREVAALSAAVESLAIDAAGSVKPQKAIHQATLALRNGVGLALGARFANRAAYSGGRSVVRSIGRHPLLSLAIAICVILVTGVARKAS